MKQFFKFMFASFIGTVLALVALCFLSIVIVAGVIGTAGSNHEETVARNSVLELKLDYPIEERTSNNPLSVFNFRDFSLEAQPGLNDILREIHKAKTDENIKGIYMELSSLQAGIATVEEIRNALSDFKTSGKFLVAYGEEYSQAAYYLASVADKIYLYPEGSIAWKGLKAEIMFFKGALSKLEVEPEIIRHGKFKSAVEPYLLDKMSAENREQIAAFTGTIWTYILENISRSRNIPAIRLQELADNLSLHEADACLKNRFVDSLFYCDQMLSNLRKRLHLAEDAKISFISLKKYAHNTEKKQYKEFIKDKIAVIYASGEINEGREDNTINSSRLTEALRKARLDKNVKAIVLRVNSPGGSALASDIIWREVEITKKVKPIVASFGDYAASGGYYISCAANRIVAQPNTITGSIGVFGVLFNAQKLLNNKLGITVDTVKTAKLADYGSTWRPLSASEKDLLQTEIEHIYHNFVSKVAKGRNLRPDFIDSIGQGRVWSAIDGKRLGLVDKFGGLQTAIDEAAALAHISKYKTTELPEQKETLQRFLEGMSDEAKASLLPAELKESYPFYQRLNKLLNNRGIQARIPFDIDLY